MAPSCAADTGEAPMSLPSLLRRPRELVDHPVRRGLGVAALGHRLEIVGGLALGDEHVGVVGRQAEVGDETRLLGVRQFRQAAWRARRRSPASLRAAGGRDRGNSGSRAPLPSSASSASRRVSASNRRVSWSIVPPSSMISIWRRASYSIAWPMKRIELTFLISQRVPSGSPGRRTETLTSARSEPCSMLPSQVPR